MSMVKDLKNNEELVKNIVEDLEDFDEYDNITYEVWAMGYDQEGAVSGAEMLINSFADPDVAVRFAANTTLAEIVHQAAEEDGNKEFDVQLSHISVEVETVVDDENEGTMNIGTIYRKDIYLDEELEADEVEYEVVSLTEKNYKLCEDGSIEVPCVLLSQFNKNDQVQFVFDDEDNKPVLTYKIISKTSDDKYICEFIY